MPSRLPAELHRCGEYKVSLPQLPANLMITVPLVLLVLQLSGTTAQSIHLTKSCCEGTWVRQGSMERLKLPVCTSGLACLCRFLIEKV